jgi:hypothetical protein
MSCEASDAVSGDGGWDWIHSDYGNEDEAGVGQIGEYPPRIRRLRKRYLMTLRRAVKCEPHESSRTVLARPQILDPYPGKRNGARFHPPLHSVRGLTSVVIFRLYRDNVQQRIEASAM